MIYYGGECARCYDPADMDNSDLFMEVPSRPDLPPKAKLIHKNAMICYENRRRNGIPDSASGPDNGSGDAAAFNEHEEANAGS